MNKITVEIVVNSDVKKAWRFWNEPAHIQQWAFASDDWECPFAENNLVVGGTFTTRMSAKDKSVGFDFTGTYLEVKEFKTIRYIMSNDVNDASARTCTVTFEALGDGQTKITEVFDAETEHSDEQQKKGWQSILNNFKKAVEAAK